jgi:hypothetical protein
MSLFLNLTNKLYPQTPFTQQQCHVFPRKTYTLLGFELSPSVPEADETEPHGQGITTTDFYIYFSFEQSLCLTILIIKNNLKPSIIFSALPPWRISAQQFEKNVNGERKN